MCWYFGGSRSMKIHISWVFQWIRSFFDIRHSVCCLFLFTFFIFYFFLLYFRVTLKWNEIWNMIRFEFEMVFVIDHEFGSDDICCPFWILLNPIIYWMIAIAVLLWRSWMNEWMKLNVNLNERRQWVVEPPIDISSCNITSNICPYQLVHWLYAFI